MSKYLKLIIFYTVFFSFAVFSFSVNAQNTDQNQAEEEEKEEEEEEEEEAIKTITTPQLIPAAELSGIESNDIIENLRNPISSSLSIAQQSILLANINNPLTSKLNFNQQVRLIGYQNDSTLSNLSLSGLVVLAEANLAASQVSAIGSSGVDSAEIISLGTTNIQSLASKLSGTATVQATQFKTLVNVVDAYSNTSDNGLIGRRAIDTTVDLSTIVSSTVKSVSTEHLDTLSNLDTSHMKTFATGGIKYIDNFTTSVDVTHAFLSEDFANSEKTFDAAVLTSHINSIQTLTKDEESLAALKQLDRSHMKTIAADGIGNIDNFATKAEVVVVLKEVGGENADFGAIAKTIQSTIKDDHHFETLKKLNKANMKTFAGDSAAAAGGTMDLENFTTRVAVTHAFLSDSDGKVGTFDATTLTEHIDSIHTMTQDAESFAALKSLDHTHMKTIAADGIANIDKFATKAEVVVVFKEAGGANADFSAIAKTIQSTIKDDHHFETLKKLDKANMKTFAGDSAAAAGGTMNLENFTTRVNVTHAFLSDADGKMGTFDDNILKGHIDNIHTMSQDADSLAALKEFDHNHMKTMAADGIAKISQFATKVEVAKVYKDKAVAAGSVLDLALIAKGVHDNLNEDHLIAMAEFDASHMATMAGSVDLSSVANVGTKAKVAKHRKDDGEDVAAILAAVNKMPTDTFAHLEGMSADDLKTAAKGGDLSKLHTNLEQKGNLHDKGIPLANINNLTAEELEAMHKKTADELKTIADNVKSGGDIKEHAASALVEHTEVSSNADVDKAAKSVKIDALGKDNDYTNALATVTTGFPKALESAVKIAEMMLTDKVINSDSDLADDLNVASLSGNGYNTELIRILAKYGALGSKGGALADAVMGSEFTVFNKSIDLSSKVQPNTSSYQQFISTLGARAMGQDKTNNAVHNNTVSVSTSNIKLSPGANITFNASAEIDSSDVLPKGDRRIAIIGAAKDMTIKGNLNIKNSNTEENGVMVLGAASDLYFRSADNSLTADADYSGNPNVVSITNEGANLALGSEKTLRLVNVSVSTGGNLAIGTLNNLHIGTSTAQQNTLSVGNGGQNSDPDNIYLYANELIQVNGLQITGRVDDVYMEAVTINLRNVTFPHTSEVTLRSRNGTIGFSNTATPTVGSVNMYNVKHGSDLLSGSSFNGVPGKYATNKVLPNGTPAVQVKKF